ncbi:Pentatricopeptide repeat-containing protein [Nymphaea thermarum]|nr:Pentatricopeptide repeat-containing protein [Nymphaea thermarum]
MPPFFRSPGHGRTTLTTVAAATKKKRTLFNAAAAVASVSTSDERKQEDLNSLVFKLCREGRLKRAVRSLFCFGAASSPASYGVYCQLLQECIRLGAGKEAVRVHAHMAFSGFPTDVYMANVLLDVYVKCGCLRRARQVFDGMPQKDVVSWTTIISGFAGKGLHGEAFSCFRDMLRSGVSVNEFALTAVLRACSDAFLVGEGAQVHGVVLKASAAMPNLCVDNVLISMYVRFGEGDCAQRVFNWMPERDVISWNCLMPGRVGGAEGFFLFNGLLEDGLKPTDITFVNLLGVSASSSSLIMGQQVHAQVLRYGLEGHQRIGCGLINMYSNAGRLDHARQVFDGMTVRDTILWTGMIDKCVVNGYPALAMELFSRMLQEGISIDHIAITTILSSCSSAKCLERGKHIHCFSIKNGLEVITFVKNSLVTMYAKCQTMADAQRAFSESSLTDAVSFNALISGHVQAGNYGEALGVFCQMHREGLHCNHISLTGALGACSGQIGDACFTDNSLLGEHIHAHVVKSGYELNLFVGNTLLTMYAHCGSLASAEKVFEIVAFQRDAVSWNALISSYGRFGMDEDALKLFQRMHHACVPPTSLTFVIVLSSAANVASLDQGKQVAACIEKSGFLSRKSMRNALITMYAKCGRIDDAFRIFDNMRDRDLVTWNAMITRFAQHGMGKAALDLFNEMQCSNINPDSVTFVGILTACSHVGLLEEGKRFFESMIRTHNIKPRMEHYACMVDILGRMGHLDDAVKFIQEMPIPSSSLQWRILLSACRKHRNSRLGKLAAEKLMELEPEDASSYALLSNIYAYEERWEEMANLRKMMKTKNLTLRSGCSWIEVKGKVHTFETEDRSHTQMLDIYNRLSELTNLIEDNGYVKDLSYDYHNVEEVHKHANLSFHSERLAIAYGDISMAPGAPITIIKNLRICGDCHTAAKLFSQVIEREIFIRDGYRFHHFKNGSCSCGDYW